MSSKIDLDVTIHQPINNGYRLKVSFTGIGMYSSGWTIRHSTINDSGWWVQPPCYKDSSGKWHKAIEFNKREELWCDIEKKCIEMAEFEDNSSRSSLPAPSERDIVAEEVLESSDFNVMLDDIYENPTSSIGGGSNAKS